MTARIELALVSPEKSFEEFAGNLAALPSLAGAEAVRSRVVLQDLETGVDGWRLWVGTEEGQSTVHAVEQLRPILPGLSRCRECVRPTAGDLAASLSAFGDVLPSLEGRDVEPGPAREMRRVQWRIGNVLATLTAENGERIILTFAAPRDDESAFDGMFSLAREAVDSLPLLLLADANAGAVTSPDAPVIYASKLDLPKQSTTREAFLEIAASVASHWFGNDAGARHSLDVDRVHQLRVAQRRLKTLLKLFPEYVDEAWNETVAPDLKWFGDLLADARDWDVFTDTALTAFAAADAGGPSWQNAIDAANTKRLAAREKLGEALRSKRYLLLSLAFVEWLGRLDARPEDEPVPLMDYAKTHVRKLYRKIARVPNLATLDVPSRHRVRIHAKRLRYALEFLRSLTTQRTHSSIAKRLGRLQTVLGEGNDAAVAAERLATLPEASDYQRGFARAWAAVSEEKDAREGERILRSIGRPRVKTLD
jgi:CHAD domain-containing protein